MAKLRSAVLVFVLGFIFFDPAANAVSLTIVTPSEGQYVQPGSNISVSLLISSTAGYLKTITVICSGIGKKEYSFSAWDGIYIFNETIDFKVPDDAAPNTSYRVVVNAFSSAFMDTATASRAVKTPPDLNAPAYSMGNPAISVKRLPGNTTASVSWMEASDDYTKPAYIKYSVYIAASKSSLYGTTPNQTLTGKTSTTLTGLDPKTTYYVGVRATDLGSHQDTNTASAVLGFYKNAAAPDAWALYR